MTTATQTRGGFPMSWALIFVALFLAAVAPLATMPTSGVVEQAPPAGYYEDAELAEIAATKMIVLDLEDGSCEVAMEHIYENHGKEAIEAVRTSGWKKGDCGDGEKSYAYKLADDGRYWLRIKWNGKVVTCYRVTWDLLLYYFQSDGCDPPHPPSHHDMMSSPAY